MMYCSFCGAADTKIPVMTTKTGETFGSAVRMTTTDAQELIWSYCQDLQNVYEEKTTAKCTTEDKVVSGFYRNVYADRICDGYIDCPNGEDELGGLGKCMSPLTSSNCCSTLLVDGHICNYNGNEYNGRHHYECDTEDGVIFSSSGNWHFGKNGLPNGSTKILYEFLVESDTTCPPIGKWGDQFVLCKSSGPDTTNACDLNPCGQNATCVDLFEGYRCECNLGFEDNTNIEFDGNFCTEIIEINECLDDSLNTCDENAICYDTLKSYTCACKTGFTDINSTNPGHSCMEIAPCCQSLKISRNIAVTGSIVISVICDKTELSNNGNYYSYDCHTIEVSDAAYSSHISGYFKLPATIVYRNYWNEWFLMSNITSVEAIAAKSISYVASQSAVDDSYCPTIGYGGEFWLEEDHYYTECLKYSATKAKSNADRNDKNTDSNNTKNVKKNNNEIKTTRTPATTSISPKVSSTNTPTERPTKNPTKATTNTPIKTTTKIATAKATTKTSPKIPTTKLQTNKTKTTETPLITPTEATTYTNENLKLAIILNCYRYSSSFHQNLCLMMLNPWLQEK